MAIDIDDAHSAGPALTTGWLSMNSPGGMVGAVFGADDNQAFGVKSVATR